MAFGNLLSKWPVAEVTSFHFMFKPSFHAPF